MKDFGFFSFGSSIPYKKPIIKQQPGFVSAKGVIDEINREHGGLLGKIPKRAPPEEIEYKDLAEFGKRSGFLRKGSNAGIAFDPKLKRRIQSAKPSSP